MVIFQMLRRLILTGVLDGMHGNFHVSLDYINPIFYKNLAVHNLVTDSYYESVIEAGMTEGLLFDDIWRSSYTKAALFPHGSIFEVIKRG